MPGNMFNNPKKADVWGIEESEGKIKIFLNVLNFLVHIKEMPGVDTRSFLLVNIFNLPVHDWREPVPIPHTFCTLKRTDGIP